MRKPKHHHSDRDRIMTPENVAKMLIAKIPADDKDSWCDPCFGQGVFYNNFPTEYKSFYEIDMGKDFLSCEDMYGWCVTNIPFSRPKEFIFKMAECSIKGFGILCLANSMTATRLEKLASMGFFVDNVTVLYIRDWGFGYRTDFYVFTALPQAERFDLILTEKEEVGKDVCSVCGKPVPPPVPGRPPSRPPLTCSIPCHVIAMKDPMWRQCS